MYIRYTLTIKTELSMRRMDIYISAYTAVVDIIIYIVLNHCWAIYPVAKCSLCICIHKCYKEKKIEG